MRISSAFALAAVACSGDDTTPTSALQCDSLESDPLGQVGTYDWPPGVREALDLYPTLEGVFDVDSSCGDDVSVVITHPPPEELEIITTPWPDISGLPCGCTVDPDYPPDPSLDLVMLHFGFEVFVDNFDDPAADDVSLVTEGAFYQPGQPLEFRSCANTNVDPLKGSVYTNMSYVVRVPDGGALEMDIVLADENGNVTTCELTDFNLQF
jgi:hypothetical protein